MRAAGRVGRTVVLRLRYGDFARATRSCTLQQPTAETHTVLAVARDLLDSAMPTIERRGVTLVGVSVANLEHADAVQLALPLGGGDRAALDEALDAVRDRFGAQALTRAVLLGRDAGFIVPLLPD
jgi:DNA polymerase-4